MCGILGSLHIGKSISAKSQQLLSNSLKIISYRGPDASQSQIFSIGQSGGELFLGHNRLSIIDLNSISNQPMSYLGKFHIVFNGEIYNYIELRNSLKQKGYNFKTDSDTEVILALYSEKGTEGFADLNGMWSFILYDSHKQKIICSRDRFGEKPLYYYQKLNGEFYFASEIKQILPFIDIQVNQDILSDYLHNYFIDHTNETFFKNIFKVPPSGLLEIDCFTGKIIEKKYWNFNISQFSQSCNTKDLVNEFKSILEDSIRIRLRSDVKVGNTLSGGLDSSSIAVIANSMVSGNFQNISVTNKSKKHSEAHFVEMLEDKNNLDVLKIPYDDVNPWTDVEKVIWHHDEPILSISTIAHYQMMRLLKEKTDITVVLSGQGGDEALGGYNKYFYHSLKDKLSTKDFTGFVKDFFLLLPKFSSEFSINAARRYTGLSGIQSNQFKCILNTKPVFKSLMTANTFMDRQIVDYFQFSVPPLCHYEDRNSMAFSKEIRLPFLDYRLAEFSINLPLDLKMKNGFTKYILRLAMDELPSKLRWRKDKKGFTLDENRYFSGTHLEFIKSQFQFSKLDEMGIIDKKRLLKSISNEKPTIWARDLGRLVFAEIWLKQFFK